MSSLKDKTIVITGASRGIGRAIAIRCAKDGANLVIAAKTAEKHPKLAGTIHSVVKECEEAGGKALAVQTDVRDETSIQEMVRQAVARFSGIDALINNAGAISLTPTAETSAKRFDLMQQVNARAVFLCTQACLPHLKNSSTAHVINLSPPLSLKPKWLAPHLAYTISKYGMSLCTLGMAEEFKPLGISVNSLWPKTLIFTAAVEMLMGEKGEAHSRTPAILADAAYAILSTPRGELTGQLLIDEDFLKTKGVKDFSGYACKPGQPLYPDLYIDSGL